jgi:Ser/Thr protein kinase RdoA (MazF antagonist)
MTAPEILRDAATRLLGTCNVTAVLARAVVRVATASGEEFVVKQHRSRLLHDREVHAYSTWTSALGPSAPALVAVDGQELVLITAALPGSARDSDLTPSVHQQAGALLRRFHNAEPPADLAWFPGWLDDRAEHWTSRAAPLLSADDARIIEVHLEALSRLPIPRGTPCHLDFQPRNWLISPSGAVSLIDFEHARVDLPARDLVRLRFRTWPGRPELRDAFLGGYGHPLTPAEDELTWHLGALDALTGLARGHENADPGLTAAGRATLQQLREQP